MPEHPTARNVKFESVSSDRAMELAAFYAALSPLKKSGSLRQLLEDAMERLMAATGADAALIRLKDTESGQFFCPAARGFDERYLESARFLPKNSAAVDFVFTHGRPVISADVGTDERIVHKNQVAFGLLSCAYLPLMVTGTVRGIVHLASRTLGFFGPEKEAHLTAIARQMSIAIENQELFQQSERRSRELHALYAIADAGRFSMDVPIITQMALVTTLKAFGLDAGRVYVLAEDDSLLHLTAHQGVPSGCLDAVQAYAPGESQVSRVFKHNEVFVSHGAGDDRKAWSTQPSAESVLAEYFAFTVGVPARSRFTTHNFTKRSKSRPPNSRNRTK